MQSHENCLRCKVRSKNVRNNEKLDLSRNENKFWTAYKFIRKESKSLIFNRAARSSVWKTLWISPLWLSWTLIALLKNNVLKIFLAFFNLQHLKNKLWLPAHILSEIYKLLENFNSFNSLDLFFIIFLLFITLYFSFLLLNLMMTFSFFLRWWHASRSSGCTSFSVKDSALQTSPSNSLFDTSRGTGEISIISPLKDWALSRDDRSKSMIRLRNNELHGQILMRNRPFFLSDHLFFQTSYQNLKVVLLVLL